MNMRNWSRLALVFSASLCLATAACDSDDPSTPASGGSGTQSGTGAGGATTATGGGGAGADCHGDADAWDQIPKTDIPCLHNSDCCVVFNACRGEGQVVSADDFATAGAVWPYCDKDCVLCILPLLDVECQHGECVGYELPKDYDGGVVEGEDHCGVGDPSSSLIPPGTLFSCVP